MGEHPHPELWLRGYATDKGTLNRNVSRIIESWNDVDEQSDVFITTRTGAIKRKATDSETSSTKSKKPVVLPEDIDNRKESAESLSSISEAMKNDHTYSMYEQSGTCMEEFDCQTRLCLKCRKEIMNILEENERLKNENEQLQKSLTEANQVITESTKRDNCSGDKIKHSDSLMKLYTGIYNYDLFEWIYNQVKEKVPFLQCYKGPDSHRLKRYQMGRSKKPS
ncbi:hypothetical protein P5673_015940 [Acropora cervicornis]|uniref:Uncharacterized protein n=1 Tax=Acropora cervicornis TaxID=6130 RepID=A0AAD9QHG1_ACRCE|nr:hypothetical protein P5673_015940 [Acropora cervicornis]